LAFLGHKKRARRPQKTRSPTRPRKSARQKTHLDPKAKICDNPASGASAKSPEKVAVRSRDLYAADRRLMPARRAHDKQKKDHRGRNSDENDDRNTDRPPFGLGKPTEVPRLHHSPGFRARWPPRIVTAPDSDEIRGTSRKPSRETKDAPTRKRGCVHGPTVTIRRAVRIHMDRRSAVRGEQMVAPCATDCPA